MVSTKAQLVCPCFTEFFVVVVLSPTITVGFLSRPSPSLTRSFLRMCINVYYMWYDISVFFLLLFTTLLQQLDNSLTFRIVIPLTIKMDIYHFLWGNVSWSYEKWKFMFILQQPIYRQKMTYIYNKCQVCPSLQTVEYIIN